MRLFLEILGDLIGAISLFATVWLVLVIGYALGG